jgi:hypothetical protein
MEMTRRQFALSLAAASYLGRSLFAPLTPLGVPRGVVPGRVTWAHNPAAPFCTNKGLAEKSVSGLFRMAGTTRLELATSAVTAF